MHIWQQVGFTLGKKFLGTTISRLLGSTPSTLAFLGRLLSALAFRLCFLGCNVEARQRLAASAA